MPLRLSPSWVNPNISSVLMSPLSAREQMCLRTVLTLILIAEPIALRLNQYGFVLQSGQQGSRRSRSCSSGKRQPLRMHS